MNQQDKNLFGWENKLVTIRKVLILNNKNFLEATLKREEHSFLIPDIWKRALL